MVSIFYPSVPSFSLDNSAIISSYTNEELTNMLWITRSHVHVDRVACPWLITRFVDSDAEFLFVPKSEIERVCAETGAIPFDAEGLSCGTTRGAALSSPLSSNIN